MPNGEPGEITSARSGLLKGSGGKAGDPPRAPWPPKYPPGDQAPVGDAVCCMKLAGENVECRCICMLARGLTKAPGDAIDCRDMCPGEGPSGKEPETMLPCRPRWLPTDGVGRGGENGIPGCCTDPCRDIGDGVSSSPPVPTPSAASFASRRWLTYASQSALTGTRTLGAPERSVLIYSSLGQMPRF